MLSTVGSNLLLKDKKLHIDVDSSLLAMKSISFPVIPKIKRLEPAVVIINKGRTQSSDQVRPMWLQVANDVRTKIMESKEYIYIPELKIPSNSFSEVTV